MTEHAFWRKVDKSKNSDGHWLWKGHIRKSVGYGLTNWSGKMVYTHRLVWFLTFGKWPEEIHHTCSRKDCVNPAHLSNVKRHENPDAFDTINRRKTHCPRGHAYPTDGTGVFLHKKKSHNYRVCLKCHPNYYA